MPAPSGTMLVGFCHVHQEGNLLSGRQFGSEADAEQWFIETRWPAGVACPFCGSLDDVAERKNRKPQPYNCKACRKDFSIKTNTLMHGSKLPLRTWALAYSHFSHWQGASSIAILGLSSQQHTVRFALVDSTHTELTNPEAASTLTFTVAQPPTGEFTLDLVADGLNFPVRMAATPAGRLFYNEMNSGQIRVLDANFSLLPQPFYSGLPRSN